MSDTIQALRRLRDASHTMLGLIDQINAKHGEHYVGNSFEVGRAIAQADTVLNSVAAQATAVTPIPQDQGLRDALEKKLIEAQAIVSCMAHRPSCVLGDDMCLCGLSQLDRVLRLPAETTLPQQAATDEGDGLVERIAKWLEKQRQTTPGHGWEFAGALRHDAHLFSAPTSQPPAAETRMALEALIEKRVPKGMDQWVRDLAREAFELAALTQPEPTAQQGGEE